MKPRLGISACLLGQSVRYDGGHKLDAALLEFFSPHFEFFPVCPEVECGLPVPREKMLLVGPTDSPRIVTVETNLDHTEQLLAWADCRIVELRSECLCGFIFKSRSPSCGRAVPVQTSTGLDLTSVGLWASAVIAAFPRLPVADEIQLQDARLRDLFLDEALAFAQANGHNSRAASAKRASEL